MPATREQIAIETLVKLGVDPKSVADVIRETKRTKADIEKILSELKVDYKEIGARADANIKKIKDISSAASAFAKDLSSASRSSFKELASLGKELESAKRKAEVLRKKYESADTPEEKEQIAKDMTDASQAVAELNKQVTDFQKANKKAGAQLSNVNKAQQRYQTDLKKAGSYTGKTMFKDILKNVSKGMTGGPAGLKGAAAGIAGNLNQGARGMAARGAMAMGKGAGGRGAMAGAGALGALSGALSGLTAAAVALGAFWELLKKASDQQTALNKALVAGTGTANDFVVGGKTYTAAVDDMRNATVDAHHALLKFGFNSEKTLKVINAFAKESTGSIIKTRTALKSLGEGDLSKGVETFAKNAVAYGKALGVEATDVGDMMGKFVSETGYGAGQVQDLMANVVRSAATANMPMTKFMSIFRRVLPDVELYQNRLEELTGTIKLLSKTMSAKDVQNFMDAFASGFKGMDFKQRLKTSLVVGVGNVSKALDKDFSMKAKSIAQNFKDYVSEEEFMKAFKGGEKAMADLMAKAQANAIANGGEIAGVHISDAMKLASYEAARQKGGPLNTATAMRGAGQYATYSILKQMSQRFTTGFDGLSEHVIKQLGITEQQYEALRTTSQSMEVYQSQLRQTGRTQSKSMNEGLREAIATRKGITDGVAKQMIDLREATEEDLFLAAELSNKSDKTARDAQDLAVEQVSVTTSIDEKIDNVLAFLLEKIYQVLNGQMMAVLQDIEDAASTDDKSKAEIKKLEKARVADAFGGPQTEAQKKQQEVRSKALRQAIARGVEGSDLIGEMKGSYTADQLKTIPALMSSYAISKGMDAKQADAMAERMREKLGEGDVNAALWQLKEMPVSWEEALEAVNVASAHNSQQVTDDVTAMMSKEGGGPMRRAGTSDVDIIKRKADLDKIERDAMEKDDRDLQYAAALAGGAVPGEAPVRMGTTTTENLDATLAGLPGSAGAGKSQAEAAKNVGVQAEAATEQVEVGKEQVDKQAAIADASVGTYDGITDVFGLLKKGIRYENGFLRGAFADVLKASFLEALRTALIEFAVIQARMEASEDFRNFMADWSWQISQAGGPKAVSALTTIDRTGASSDLYDQFSDAVSGSKLAGGPIQETGLYRLHRGEYVVPAVPAPASGPSGGPTYATVIIQGSTLSQQQLEQAAYNVLDRLARKH